jgi:hypothetical protein
MGSPPDLMSGYLSTVPVYVRLICSFSRAGYYDIIAFQWRNYAGGRTSAFQRSFVLVRLARNSCSSLKAEESAYKRSFSSNFRQ